MNKDRRIRSEAPCGRPCKKILVVRRIVASLVHRVACECTNGVQRRPRTQRDNCTAIRVEISDGNGGTKISGLLVASEPDFTADVQS